MKVFLFAGLLLLAVPVAAGYWMLEMPASSHRGPLPPPSPSETLIQQHLREYVQVLATEIGERNVPRHAALERSAKYVAKCLEAAGYSVRLETFPVQGKKVSNIIAETTGALRPEDIVLVGAHYDSQPGSPGADDNASGVAAMLELARLLGGEKTERTIRFVAFANEEYPFFQTDSMGSRVHSSAARKRGEKITAMISLESIGYYSDSPGSQKYPAPLSYFYPDRGDFIGFVGNMESGSLLRKSIATFRRETPIPSEGVIAPEWIPGIGWSDHWAFWQEGYPAVMVTDTAPYRNPHYHQASDTPDKLDYGRMARVVEGLAGVVKELAQ